MKHAHITTFGRMILGVVLLALASVSHAQNSAAEDQALHEKLSRALAAASQGQLQLVSIRPSPVQGLLELELSSGEVLLSDSQGDFLLTGDVFRTTDNGLVNLSAERRQEQVVELVAQVPEEQMIIFSPEQTRATITVFTDADCTYCRKLHHDMDEILAHGIKVRYLAFPRGGAASAVYPKMISVWCSADRQRALTQAKNGQNLPQRECDNPVLEHFSLGNRLGISGTPALVLEDGTVIPGYLDVERLTAVVLGSL